MSSESLSQRDMTDSRSMLLSQYLDEEGHTFGGRVYYGGESALARSLYRADKALRAGIEAVERRDSDEQIIAILTRGLA